MLSIRLRSQSLMHCESCLLPSACTTIARHCKTGEGIPKIDRWWVVKQAFGVIGTLGAAVGAYFKAKPGIDQWSAKRPSRFTLRRSQSAGASVATPQMDQLWSDYVKLQAQYDKVCGLRGRLKRLVLYVVFAYAGKTYADYGHFVADLEDNDGSFKAYLERQWVKGLEKRADGKMFVQVSSSVARVRELQHGHGGWVPRMAYYCGKYGVANKVRHEEGVVHVKFQDGKKWTFNREAVNCIFCSGDRVRVTDDPDKLQRSPFFVPSKIVHAGQIGVLRGCDMDLGPQDCSVLVQFGDEASWWSSLDLTKINTE